MEQYILTAVLLLAALTVLAALRYAWRVRRTMDRLERMMDEAICGSFAEERFDESRLSRAETRLAHYLSASAVSAGNTAEEKAKVERLVADISHQVKTPLSNLLLYSQLLKEQELTEDGRRCAAALGEQAGKLQSLIEGLVKMSRLDTGILTLHPKPGPLLPMLESAVSQLEPRAVEKRISLTLHPAGADAVFDAKWTEEAVCNLLDNAVKYTPEGGRVSARIIAYELFCRIDVSDTGPGIPEDEQPKVFQRFYRSAAAHDAEGVGVGLYLARQIAEGQGGYIKVVSRPGEGARFSLFLPRN